MKLLTDTRNATPVGEPLPIEGDPTVEKMRKAAVDYAISIGKGVNAFSITYVTSHHVDRDVLGKMEWDEKKPVQIQLYKW